MHEEADEFIQTFFSTWQPDVDAHGLFVFFKSLWHRYDQGQTRTSQKTKLISERTLCAFLDKATSTVAHNDIVKGYYYEVVVLAGLEGCVKETQWENQLLICACGWPAMPSGACPILSGCSSLLNYRSFSKQESESTREVSLLQQWNFISSLQNVLSAQKEQTSSENNISHSSALLSTFVC